MAYFWLYLLSVWESLCDVVYLWAVTVASPCMKILFAAAL